MPNQLIPFIKSLADLPQIEVVGLMTMAQTIQNKQQAISCFTHLQNLQQEVISQQFSYAPCLELSMGMSQDYQAALSCGTTFVRLGTILISELD